MCLNDCLGDNCIQLANRSSPPSTFSEHILYFHDHRETWQTANSLSRGGRHSPFVNSRCDNTTFSQSCEGFSSSQRLSATRVPHGAWLVSWTLALAAAAGSTGSWVHAVQRARGLSGGGPGCGAAASKGQDLTRSPRKHLTLAHSETQQVETLNGEQRPRETLFDRCVCVRVIDLDRKSVV